jgi:hypothetical protein
MSDLEVFFPHDSPRTDGTAAVERYRKAHEGYGSRMEQVEKLGAQALISAAAVLGVDPVTLGFGLRNGQLATALTAGEPLVSSEIAEKRLEIAASCVAGWAEELARRVRREGSSQADRLSGLAGEIRQEWGHMQHLLYREGTIRRTQRFATTPKAFATDEEVRSEEAILREQVVALSLEVERARAELAQGRDTVAQLEDERLQLQVQVEHLEAETTQLRNAAAGWRREAHRRPRPQDHYRAVPVADAEDPASGAPETTGQP